jgi:hypothetical protein
MNRRLPALAFAILLLAACSTSRPAIEPDVDPATEPSAIGAIDEAARQSLESGEAAARTGRKIGRVAGVIAAVFGGPRHESLDDTIDRYRDTRDAVEVTSALIGASRGAAAGAKRGFQLDLQFAELLKIEGVEATRPYPDEIHVRLAATPSAETLASIAAVLNGREPRAIEIEAASDTALDLRDALIDLGVPSTSLSTHRNDRIEGAVLRIQYRD